MLGSSSTTRILSFTTISSLSSWLSLIHGQQEREGASPLRFAFHPNLSAVRLNQAFGNGQSETHAGRVLVHAHKVFEDFLVVLGRDSHARIRYAYFGAVWTRQAEPSALFDRPDLRHTALPEMRPRAQHHIAAARRMLEGVIEEIERDLLGLLIIKSESGYRRVQLGFEFHAFALITFRTSARRLRQTIPEVIFPELQDELSALEGRIIQKHGHETDQAFAAFLALLEDVSLFFGQFSEGAGQQEIVITLDYGERGLQFVRSGCQKNRFLAVHFLQFQVRSQKIPVGDFAFLQQFLDGGLIRLCDSTRVLFLDGNLDRQPVGLGNPAPADTVGISARHVLQFNFMFATEDSPRDFLGVHVHYVLKNIQLAFTIDATRLEAFSRPLIHNEDFPFAIGDQDSAVHRVKQSADMVGSEIRSCLIELPGGANYGSAHPNVTIPLKVVNFFPCS